MLNVLKHPNFKKVINIFICFFFSLYVLSVFAFDEMPKIHLLTYISLSFLTLFTIASCIINRKIFFNKYLLLYLFFFAYCVLISLVNNRFDIRTFSRIFIFFSMIVVFNAWKFINNKHIMQWLMIIPGIIYLCLFLYVYRHEILTLSFAHERLGSFFGNENSVGVSFFMFFALTLYVTVFEKKYWVILLSFLFAFAAFTTGSKKIFIGIILAFMLCFIYLLRKHVVWMIISLASIILIFFVIINIPTFAEMKQRLIDMIVFLFSGDGDASSMNRQIFAEIATMLGLRNMFFGWGEGAFEQLTIFVSYSHNNLTELFCSFGLLGLCLFYSMFLIVFKNYKAVRKDSFYLFPLFMFIFLIVISVGMVFYEEKQWVIYYVIALYLSDDLDVPLVKKKISV